MSVVCSHCWESCLCEGLLRDLAVDKAGKEDQRRKSVADVADVESRLGALRDSFGEQQARLQDLEKELKDAREELQKVRLTSVFLDD